MGWKKFLKKYKQKLMLIGAIAFVILMLGETIIMINRGGGGGVVLTEAELKKYEFIPPQNNFTVIVFTAPVKECPICPELLQNLTQAVDLVNKALASENITIRAQMKVFECNNFPQCSNTEALINFKLYGVSQVPLVIVSYRGFLVPINVVGMSPEQMARLMLAWLALMSHAWKPPKTGVAVVYFYDSLHNSTQWQDLLSLLKDVNVTTVALGCKVYPSNCTNNTQAYATMLVYGIRPEQLPLLLVYKDGRLVASYQLNKPQDLIALAQEIKQLAKNQ